MEKDFIKLYSLVAQMRQLQKALPITRHYSKVNIALEAIDEFIKDFELKYNTANFEYEKEKPSLKPKTEMIGTFLNHTLFTNQVSVVLQIFKDGLLLHSTNQDGKFFSFQVLYTWEYIEKNLCYLSEDSINKEDFFNV